MAAEFTGVTLIRHGCAMPPSPWQGEGYGWAILAFPWGKVPQWAHWADEGNAEGLGAVAWERI